MPFQVKIGQYDLMACPLLTMFIYNRLSSVEARGIGYTLIVGGNESEYLIIISKISNCPVNFFCL